MQRGKYIEFILILGALTACVPLSIDMYLPALPTIERALRGTTAQGQFTLATFFCGFAIGQLLFGVLADRFGRKPPLYAGLVLFVVASILCALTPTMGWLAFLRFMQAFGACAGMVIGRAMVRDLFEPQDMIRVLAALMLVMGVAPILAPLFGGYILIWLNWHAIFWTLAAFGVLCFFATVLLLPETHRDKTPEFGKGALELGRVFKSYAELFKHRRYMGYTLSGAFSSGGMFAYIAGSPFVFIDLYGVPPQHYGWLFASNAFGLIAASQINGRLLHKHYGMEHVLHIAGYVQAIAGVLLLVDALTHFGGLVGIMLPLFVYIATGGCIMPNSSTLAMAPFHKNAGTASALLGSVQFTIAALAALAVGALHAHSVVPMAAVIAACGVLGVILHEGLVQPRKTPALHER